MRGTAAGQQFFVGIAASDKRFACGTRCKLSSKAEKKLEKKRELNKKQEEEAERSSERKVTTDKAIEIILPTNN